MPQKSSRYVMNMGPVVAAGEQSRAAGAAAANCGTVEEKTSSISRSLTHSSNITTILGELKPPNDPSQKRDLKNSVKCK